MAAALTGSGSGSPSKGRKATAERREIPFEGGRIEIAMNRLSQLVGPGLFEQAASVLQQSIGVRSLSRR